jgi:hypothetical protein
MSEQDSWLLEPVTHTSYPKKKEVFKVKTSVFRRNDIDVTVYHPQIPGNHELHDDLAYLSSGWTERKLEPLAKAVADIGMHAACFDHPRRGAIRDLGHLLVTSPMLIRNWRQFSQAILEEKDIAHAEAIMMDMISDKVDDKSQQKRLVAGAVNAGKARVENVSVVLGSLAEQGYRVHGLGHSLGGIDYILAACQNPDAAQSYSLAGSGGLISADTVNEIVPRMIKTVVHERTELINSPLELARMAINTVVFVSQNPALILYEGSFAATSRLENSLWKLADDYKKPGVLIIGKNDPLFTEEKVLASVGNVPFSEIVRLEAGHNMTLHQRKEIARILGNTAYDLHNKTSGRLEVNLHNLRHVRRDLRPDGAWTMADVERDLFARND